MKNAIQYLCFNMQNIAWIGAIAAVVVIFAVLVITLCVTKSKKRKTPPSAEQISDNIVAPAAVQPERESENTELVGEKISSNTNDLSEDIVKTVYTRKEDNYSKTEYLPIPEVIASDELEYEFAGWDKNFINEKGEVVVQAIFIKRPKYYKVNIFDGDRETLLKTISTQYGSPVDLTDIVIPEKASDENYDYYFTGWENLPEAVTADTDIYPHFEGRPKLDAENFSAEDMSGAETEEIEVAESVAEEAEENFDVSDEVIGETTEAAEENAETIESDAAPVEESKVEEAEKSSEEPGSGTPAEEQSPTTEKLGDFTADFGEDEIIEEYGGYDEYEDMGESYMSGSDSHAGSDTKNDDETAEKPFIRTEAVGSSAGMEETKAGTGSGDAEQSAVRQRSKNGFNISVNENVGTKFYDINVDNKSSENDDLLRRLGMGFPRRSGKVGGEVTKSVEFTPSESVMSGPFKSRKMEQSRKRQEEINGSGTTEETPKETYSRTSTEDFLTSSIMVSHKKTVK